MTINIIVAGPRGRMGSEVIHMLTEQPHLNLVACIDRKHDGKKLRDIPSLPDLDVPVFEDPEQCLQSTNADVLIELTIPESGYRHTSLAIKHGVRPVVGTSGFTKEQIDELTDLAQENKLGGLIAPNFAIGAVLMMQFSQMAAKFLPDVEIIEKHHDQKVDAPSGTAMKTVELIQKARKAKSQGHPDEVETLPHVRGAETDGIRLHSVRLPGLVAHQEVIFGGNGQTLTITHDSYNRESFMAGVKFAVEKVMEMDKLVYGLENVLT
ncbi:MAG TPA: 4-hydroxy-tetrahydrodipicolinate reductase [Bacillota bacterium]|nr:4-hydroxy-tetrahydrodipicolinate reductase [Bacillota bacterium]